MRQNRKSKAAPLGTVRAWVLAHPNAGSGDARAAGLNPGSVQVARWKLRKEGRIPPHAPRVEEPRALAPARTNGHDADPLVRLVHRLEEELGVEELHYTRGTGELEIVARRRVRIHP